MRNRDTVAAQLADHSLTPLRRAATSTTEDEDEDEEDEEDEDEEEEEDDDHNADDVAAVAVGDA